MSESFSDLRERYGQAEYEVEAGGNRISTVTEGGGEQQVILLHGLGGTKASFFGTVSALSGRHTVHAIDFPGFGDSSKPATAPYDAEWFAQCAREFMDALGIERAHLVGNSMGGRVAIEMGFLEPDRVASLSLLAPALALRRRRHLVPLVRLLRPRLAAIPHPIVSAIVRDQANNLFADSDRIDREMLDLGCEEFCRRYRSASSRIAFYAAARNIYLDSPFGERGFWTRLAALDPPSLFVFGDSDRLVPAAFSRHVCEVLPDARCAVLDRCGHVPQLEWPQQTHALIREQIGAATNLGSSMRRWANRAAS